MPDDERPPFDPLPEEDLVSMVQVARAIVYGSGEPRTSVTSIIVALARTVVHLAEKDGK